MSFPTSVTIVEIAPRDGFQNTKAFIPTEKKIRIVEKLIASGIKDLQIGSFVSPKAIPQMQDSEQVVDSVTPRYPECRFSVLVPNEKGAQRAAATGIPEITYVISVTESHNKANVNRRVAESFEELKRIIESPEFPFDRIKLDLATTFGCPFEGSTPFDLVRGRVLRAVEIGINDICLCDTIGTATPKQTRALVENLLDRHPEVRFRVHFHDTRGAGIANSLAAVESGITVIETSAAGIGGCPFAPGAAGNTSTEDLVFLLDAMEIDTGIDLSKLMDAAKYVVGTIEKPNASGHLIDVDDDKLFLRGLYRSTHSSR